MVDLLTHVEKEIWHDHLLLGWIKPVVQYCDGRCPLLKSRASLIIPRMDAAARRKAEGSTEEAPITSWEGKW